MDNNLIEKAMNIPYMYWSDIEKLIQKTSDPPTIEKLKKIMIEKYHQEEYSVNNL